MKMKTWPEVWGIECIDVDIKAGVWHRTHCVTSLLQKSFTSENSLRFISLALDIITSVLTAASLTLSLRSWWCLFFPPQTRLEMLFVSELTLICIGRKEKHWSKCWAEDWEVRCVFNKYGKFTRIILMLLLWCLMSGCRN